MEKTKNWRKPFIKKPDFKKAYNPYPTTRFFDNLCFIGDESVACFLLETSDGLMLIDCLWPKDHHLEMIKRGIIEAGYALDDLKKILITHGHADHFGKAGELRELTGAKIYLSEIDYHLAKATKKSDLLEPITFTIDHYLEDGQDVTLGDTSVHCVLTPGHTPGCMSFIIPVTDEGRPHHLALWGGTGLLTDSDPAVYLNSVEKFHDVCVSYNVDAEISNHPFVDNTIERLEVVRNICIGVANPFVIGQEAYSRYEDRFRQIAIKALQTRQLIDPKSLG